MAALEMKGSIHAGAECARLEKELDEIIAARETRVIFDMAVVVSFVSHSRNGKANAPSYHSNFAECYASVAVPLIIRVPHCRVPGQGMHFREHLAVLLTRIQHL